MKREVFVSVYTPASAFRSPCMILRQTILSAWSGFELAWILAVRDIQAQYRQAFLGVTWLLLIPLANILVWVFMHSTGAVRFESSGAPYPVYVITGVMLWSVFVDAVIAPLQQAQSAKPMLAKLNFPRESLIIAGAIQSLFTGCVKFFLLMIALMWLGVELVLPHLFVPIVLLGLVLIGTMFGTLLIPLSLVYTDVGRGLPTVLQFGMYLSPVVYSTSGSGSISWWVQMNPMTKVLEFSRAIFMGQWPQTLLEFMGIIGVAAFGALVALVLLRATWPILIERMGS